jgi:hypothetical protein
VKEKVKEIIKKLGLVVKDLDLAEEIELQKPETDAFE